MLVHVYNYNCSHVSMAHNPCDCASLSLSLLCESWIHLYNETKNVRILGPRDPFLTFLMSDTGARFVGSALGAAIAETAARTSHRG